MVKKRRFLKRQGAKAAKDGGGSFNFGREEDMKCGDAEGFYSLWLEYG
jgi:hypothetical protein